MSQFLDFVASQCDQLHFELELQGGHASRRTATDRSKMVIEVKSSSHLALVEAWEHQRCLDVTVLELKSAGSKSLSAGPCATDEEAASRIDALRRLLQLQSGAEPKT